MSANSRLGLQFTELVTCLTGVGARFALIGGLALASHRVVRATMDVDFLAEAGKADAIDAALRKLGYQSLYRTANVGNYVRGDERVDLLYAVQPISARLLASAPESVTSLGTFRVVSAEGLIGFKLQALGNDARRTQDIEDIRALLRANRDTLDMGEVRSYFQLFKREDWLDEFLNEKP
jgi:hypothetical protein